MKTIRNREVILHDSFIEILNVDDFNLDHIFDCGQAFRWERNIPSVCHSRRITSYTGVACGRVATMEFEEDTKTLRIYQDDTIEHDFESIWYDYLDLGRDYGKIKRKLRGRKAKAGTAGKPKTGATGAGTYDPVMAEAIKCGSGIRILRQELWETLVSFIISQNNNIPRIKKCINGLAELLGEPAGQALVSRQNPDGRVTAETKTFYNLPKPEVLANATVEDLAPVRLGYRAKYLIEAAQQYCDMTETPQTAEDLLEFQGVGPKVANCIALFGLGLTDSFPIDVWMKRVMNELYGIDENDAKAMQQYAADHFGAYGGIAQQYLFYYITHR